MNSKSYSKAGSSRAAALGRDIRPLPLSGVEFLAYIASISKPACPSAPRM